LSPTARKQTTIPLPFDFRNIPDASRFPAVLFQIRPPARKSVPRAVVLPSRHDLRAPRFPGAIDKQFSAILGVIFRSFWADFLCYSVHLGLICGDFYLISG
jgi:hypothetical protein